MDILGTQLSSWIVYRRALVSVFLHAPVALLSFPMKEIRCAELGASYFQPFRPLPRLPGQDSPSLSIMSPRPQSLLG